MGERMIAVPTTGSAGAATGANTSSQLITGFLVRIYVSFDPTAPATTTVTIAEAGDNPVTLLTLSAGNTNANYPILVQAVSVTGAALTGVYAQHFISGRYITVTVGASNALTEAVRVRVITAVG